MERDGSDILAEKGPEPTDYICDLEDADDLSEAQKIELLTVLFEIMKSFVLMGYGMEPVNRLVESFEKSALGEAPMLEFEDEKHQDNSGAEDA